MLTVKPSRQVSEKRIPTRCITSSVSKVETRSRRSVQMRHDGLLLVRPSKELHKCQSKEMKLESCGVARDTGRVDSNDAHIKQVNKQLCWPCFLHFQTPI